MDIDEYNRIWDTLDYASATLNGTAVAVFATVAETQIRKIYGIHISNDNSTNPVRFTVSKIDESGNSSVFIKPWVDAAGNYDFPPGGFDPKSPVLTLEGGTTLKANASAGEDGYITVLYFDYERE